LSERSSDTNRECPDNEDRKFGLANKIFFLVCRYEEIGTSQNQNLLSINFIDNKEHVTVLKLSLLTISSRG